MIMGRDTVEHMSLSVIATSSKALHNLCDNYISNIGLQPYTLASVMLESAWLCQTSIALVI